MAEVEQGPVAGRNRTKLIALIAVALLTVAGTAVGTTMLFMRGGTDASATDELTGSEEADGSGAEGSVAPSLYVALDPAFVVNFQDKQQRTKFLKAEISVVVNSPQVQEAVTAHMPAVRNSVVMLLGRQVYEELLTTEGKEKLRADALAEIQAVMDKQAGKTAGRGVKDLYFSALVMQ